MINVEIWNSECKIKALLIRGVPYFKLHVYLIFWKSIYFQIKKEVILRSPRDEYGCTIRRNTHENIWSNHSSDTALMSLPSEEARNMIRGPEYLLYLV